MKVYLIGSLANRSGGPAHEWAYRGGAPDERRDDPSGRPFTTDLSYYEARCRACHRRDDRRNPKRRAVA